MPPYHGCEAQARPLPASYALISVGETQAAVSGHRTSPLRIALKSRVTSLWAATFLCVTLIKGWRRSHGTAPIPAARSPDEVTRHGLLPPSLR